MILKSFQVSSTSINTIKFIFLLQLQLSLVTVASYHCHTKMKIALQEPNFLARSFKVPLRFYQNDWRRRGYAHLQYCM